MILETGSSNVVLNIEDISRTKFCGFGLRLGLGLDVDTAVLEPIPRYFDPVIF